MNFKSNKIDKFFAFVCSGVKLDILNDTLFLSGAEWHLTGIPELKFSKKTDKDDIYLAIFVMWHTDTSLKE